MFSRTARWWRRKELAQQRHALVAWRSLASRSARAAHLLSLYLMRVVHRELLGGWSRWQRTVTHARLALHRAANHSIRVSQRAQAIRLMNSCAKRWQRRRLSTACNRWRSSTVRLLTTDERMKWHARRVLDVWSQFSLRTAWCSWCWWWRNQKSKVARLARLVGIARRWRFQQITVCWSRWSVRYYS